MPLNPPKLDDRTFTDLVEEAKARIPRYTPEWTNFNDSDPGITLVKLHAWLTETVLYRLNRLPELNYIKFLNLLDVRPQPAVPAKAELTFTLRKLNDAADPLVVLIPKGSRVAVDDPDLEEELIFETDRTLTALNAALASVIVPDDGDNPWKLATEYDPDEASTKFTGAFYPFGNAPAAGAAMLFAILLRPHRKDGVDYELDRFPEGELDLTVFVPDVFETDANRQPIEGPKGIDCLFPWQVQDESDRIVWEVFTGSEPETEFPDDAWVRLSVQDETAALSRSGHVYLEIPGGLPAVSFMQLSRSFWESLGLKKPPSNAAELADDVRSGLLAPDELNDEDWQAMGLTDPALRDLLSLLGDAAANRDAIADLIEDNASTLDPRRLEVDTWLEVAPYDPAPAPHGLTWFRAHLQAEPDTPPQLSRLLLNTVSATAAVTRVEEIVGDDSDGRPGQTRTLSRRPILVDPVTGKPDLQLEVAEPSETTVWEYRENFYGAGPADPVYTLDPEKGLITFGDGEHGRIPVAGARFIARSYRYGGGAVGNVGKETITGLQSALPEVESVTNLRPASGGADTESLDDVMLRAPHDLRTRDRAVTAEDFAYLALRTPGVRIQRAYSLPLTRLDRSTDPPALVPDSPGAVTVVILPENKENTPQPSESQLRLVCAHLNERRLITTELFVVGPRYLRLDRLYAEVTVRRNADLKSVRDAVIDRLLGYFHPLRGGEDGNGWPFGGSIFFGSVFRQILAVPNVQRVLCLEIVPEAVSGEVTCDDVIPLEDGYLVHLPRENIELKVKYDPFS
jgi:hypothetical protein